MAKDLKPSTQWKERIAPDEAQRYAGYAQQFASIQARKSKKYGAGRALHRKQLTAAKGTLDVLPNLPPFARHGLFAKPARFDVWVRLSNGGMDRASDRVPDSAVGCVNQATTTLTRAASHRPLGDVMRARKVVYFESQKGRGAA